MSFDKKIKIIKKESWFHFIFEMMKDNGRIILVYVLFVDSFDLKNAKYVLSNTDIFFDNIETDEILRALFLLKYVLFKFFKLFFK